MNTIEKALDIARNFGDIDGAHHKQWCLERAFRGLCLDEYVDRAKRHFEWEEGVSP